MTNIREELRTGVHGWLDDDLAFTKPWGFVLGAFTVPTQRRHLLTNRGHAGEPRDRR